MDYTLYRTKFNLNVFRTILLSNALLFGVVLLLAIKIVTISAGVNFPHNILFADITKSSLEDLTNQTRQSLGLNTLNDDSTLDQAAQLKAEDMVQNDYFAHTSPTGITPWYWFSKVGYTYQYAGENLAVGFYDSDQVYQAWLNSPEHKANLLNPNYKDTGIAVMNGLGQNDAIVVVQLFGSAAPATSTKSPQTPKPAVAAPINNLQASSVTLSTTPTAVSAAQSTSSEDSNGAATGKVLAQSITATIQPAKSGAATTPISKILNFFMQNDDAAMQNILYGVSMLVIGLLLTLIFFSANFTFERKLVVRSAMVVGLLIISLSINQQAIMAIFPHGNLLI